MDFPLKDITDKKSITPEDVEKIVDTYAPEIRRDPARARFCGTRKMWFYSPEAMEELGNIFTVMQGAAQGIPGATAALAELRERVLAVN